jgi:hypothetical protein
MPSKKRWSCESKLEAVRLARELLARVKRLEPQRRWKVRVWNNIGWHYAVESTDGTWYVSNHFGNFCAGICLWGEAPAMYIHASSRSLRAAFREARELASDTIRGHQYIINWLRGA